MKYLTLILIPLILFFVSCQTIVHDVNKGEMMVEISLINSEIRTHFKECTTYQSINRCYSSVYSIFIEQRPSDEEYRRWNK